MLKHNNKKMMKVLFLVVSLFVSFSGSTAIDGPASCMTNPECAPLGLADNCCPTNLAGIFLDCCEEPSSSCAANPGCAGLVDDCCPTANGDFLYCCFDHFDDRGYQVCLFSDFVSFDISHLSICMSV